MLIGGGLLNLALGSSMTTEECLEIVKKLDDISQNKFYTINVYDVVESTYYGDFEVLGSSDTAYALINNGINDKGVVTVLTYVFKRNGEYVRTARYYKFSDILSRLDVIEQHLGL